MLLSKPSSLYFHPRFECVKVQDPTGNNGETNMNNQIFLVIKVRQVPFSGGFSILILLALALVNSSLQERIETISAALQGHMDDEEAEEEPSSGYRPPLECEPFL